MSGKRARWIGNRAGLKGLLFGALAAYILYAVAMIVLHPRFIYPFFAEDRVLDGFERVQIGGGDVPVFVQERPGAGPVVLYFMGNAGSVSLFGAAFERHIAADRHVIALEYRGGAGRLGMPSETVLKEDALLAVDYAAALGKPLIVQGYSLGTGLATFVASRREVDGVILTAPYDRLCRLMAARSYLPACLLPFVQKWRSLEAARAVKAPILVLHGSVDTLIPPAYSAGFASLAGVERQIIEGAGHDDIGGFPTYRAAIEHFLQSIELP